MRVQKLKTNTSVRGSLKHAFRDIETPNSEESRRVDNSHHGAESTEEAMKAYKELLPEKIRKNGVRCLEYLMTASPEKMNELTKEQQDAYFKDCRNWLEEKHGKENVFYSGIHRDESTPHMYAYVVPLSQEKDQEGNLVKPGKLNAREFTGGHSKNMSDMQTDFAERVGKPHGFERGIKGSRAHHKTVKQYYGELEAMEGSVSDIQKPRTLYKEEVKGNAVEKVKKGVSNFFHAQLEKPPQIIGRLAVQLGQTHRAAKSLQDENKTKDKTIESLDSKLKEFDTLRDLPEKDRKDLLDKAELIKFKKEQEQKRERERKAQERKSRTQTKSRGYSR